MPSTIPYDPSLTLMSVVNDKALENVIAIAEAQAPADAAKDNLNSLISSKRGLTMTKTELRNLGVSTDALDRELENLDKAIETAAAEYASAKMTSEAEVLKLKAQVRMVNKSIESPVDYMRSAIKTMPLAADTMNMDVQYFSFDSSQQNSATYSSKIAAYVSRSVSSVFGPNVSMEVGTAASSQVSSQLGSHQIEGTLVLSVTCTHKNASIIAPFVLHTDKAIKVWNHLFPDDKLDPTSQTSMMRVSMSESKEDRRKFSIISGTTFGSSFVGMVHIINATSTSASESLNAAAQSMQATMDAGAWFAKAEGKIGVNSKFASDVKNLLSQQNVQSHVTLLTMGVIPSMVANEVGKTVEKFANFSPEDHMKAVAAIQAGNSDEQSTVKSMAESSRASGQASDMKNKEVEATLSAISVIDGDRNKVLDTNSMMTALDDYLQKAAEGDCGVPINFYLKDIDQKMLAQMWVAKYFPGQYLSIKYDDTEGAGPAEQEKAKL